MGSCCSIPDYDDDSIFDLPHSLDGQRSENIFDPSARQSVDSGPGTHGPHLNSDQIYSISPDAGAEPRIGGSPQGTPNQRFDNTQAAGEEQRVGSGQLLTSDAKLTSSRQQLKSDHQPDNIVNACAEQK